MPNDLLLIRHGESEGNVAVRAAKHGDLHYYTDEFLTTPGHRWRLTDRGRAQAAAAGKWVQDNVTEAFDRYYVSPYIRTRETAAHLNLPNASWLLNRALRERDWGDIGSTHIEDFKSRPEFELNAANKERDPLYWAPPNGESIAQVAEDRVRNVLSTLHRECTGQRVVCVTHGEAMWAFRLVLERMNDEEFTTKDADKSERINNCEILHYTRLEPGVGLQAGRLSWLRRVRPVLDNDTWVMREGPWVPLSIPYFTNDELLSDVSHAQMLHDGLKGV